jgi:hypothetical protein
MAAIRGAIRKITPNDVEGIQETDKRVSPSWVTVVGHWSDPKLHQTDDLFGVPVPDSEYLSAGLSAGRQDLRALPSARMLVLYCGDAHLTHINRGTRVT